VRIDYPRRRIWVKAVGDTRARMLGTDYVASKEIGALLVANQGVVLVYRVEKDGAAARYGLREGDAIVAPQGEKLPELEAIHTKIKAREDLTVARTLNGVAVDLALPEASSSEAPK
jgi:predicted metalloprotease with PDZ domain